MNYIWSILRFVAVLTARVDVIREVLALHPKADPFVSVVNAVIAGNIAYTTSDLRRVYVDFAKFQNAPMALRHVLDHELAHTEGAVHGDGSRAMAYHVSVSPSGEIIEDNFL